MASVPTTLKIEFNEQDRELLTRINGNIEWFRNYVQGQQEAQDLRKQELDAAMKRVAEDMNKQMRIQVGSRLHEDDLVGPGLKLGDWEHLNLPIE